MTVTSRPIQIDDSAFASIQTVDVTFSYEFEDLSGRSFYISKITDYDNGLVGPKLSLQTPQQDPCVTFDNKQYVFDSVIFTNGMDKIGDTQFSYTNRDYFSFVVKTNLTTNSTMSLYLVFPVYGDLNEASNDPTPNDVSIIKNEINDNISDIVANDTYPESGISLNLNINNLIPATNFYFYYANQNIFVVFTQSSIELQLWWQAGTITDLFDSDPNETTIVPSDIYMVTKATPTDIILPTSYEDIYIECSPTDVGTNSEIIKPNEVYSISPLIDPETLGNNSTMFVVLFITIIISYLSYTLGPKAIDFILSIGNEDKREIVWDSISDNSSIIFKNVSYICAIFGIVWSSFFLTQDMLEGNINMGTIYSSNSQIYVPMVACLLFSGGMLSKIFDIRNQAIKLLSPGQGYNVADRKSFIAGGLLFVCIFVFCILFANILSMMFISADSKPTNQTIAIFSIFITPILSFFSLDTYTQSLFPSN